MVSGFGAFSPFAQPFRIVPFPLLVLSIGPLPTLSCCPSEFVPPCFDLPGNGYVRFCEWTLPFPRFVPYRVRQRTAIIKAARADPDSVGGWSALRSNQAR